MKGDGTDKLWPVLMALVVLLGSGLVLQIVAEGHEADPRIIQIASSAGATIADEDTEDDGVTSFEDSEPLDGDHASARRAAHRGQVKEALGLYDKTHAAHPDSGELAAEYGYWLLVSKRNVEALSVLKRAAALLPSNSRIALNLGLAHGRVGDSAASETELRRALELRPSYGAALVALGGVLRKRGRTDEAIELLEKATESGGNEERARALVALGRALLDAGHADRARRSFEQAIERAPAAPEVRVSIARGYLAARDADAALQVLDKALIIAPDVPQVHAVLGQAMERKGDDSAAERAYEDAIRLDPGYRFARRRLFRLALQDRDYPRAKMQVEHLIADAPDDPEHVFLAGLLAARRGDSDEARSRYRDAIEKAEGDYPEAYFNLGRLEKAAGRTAAAIEAYKKAIELRPGYREAANNLGLAYKSSGDLDAAEAEFRRAIALDERYAAAWLNLGEVQAARGDQAAAIASFERALQIRPGYPAAQLNLGVALRRSGRTRDAVAAYQRLVAAQPRYVSAWHNLGIALEAIEDRAAAVTAYRQALEVNPAHLPSLRNLAQLEIELGQVAAARTVLEDLLDREPTDQQARLLLAELRLRDGDVRGCARDARLILATTPGNVAANSILRKCSMPH